jgi:hypothetical protein
VLLQHKESGGNMRKLLIEQTDTLPPYWKDGRASGLPFWYRPGLRVHTPPDKSYRERRPAENHKQNPSPIVMSGRASMRSSGIHYKFVQNKPNQRRKDNG